MHLMSFYATPYASKHRDNVGAGQVNQIRGSWFAGGLVAGLLAMYGISGLVDDNTGPVSDAAPSQNSRQMAQDEPDGAVDGESRPISERNQVIGEAMRQAGVGEEKANSDSLSGDAAALAEPADPVEEIPITVASGDTLIDILTRHGVEYGAAHVLAKTVNENYDLRKLRPGDQMILSLVPDMERATEDGVEPGKVRRLEMAISKRETLIVIPGEDGQFSVERKKKKLTRQSRRARGVINNSIYLTAAERGVPDAVIAQLIKNLSYDIDFQRDIRAGDTLDVMYEVQTDKDGEAVLSGDVLFAKLQSRGKTFQHYRYVDKDGIVGYYDEQGRSIVKKLLRTPVNGARISSRFGLRKHPVLGYSKMHKGVDFAAPTGTPIYAAGDGVVAFAGRNGGYGNMVVLKHNGMYKTAYAHAHRLAKGIRKGARVTQGETIAYVGTTGRSTGPHLHYEIRKHNKKINPLEVEFTGRNELTGAELASFREQLTDIKTQLAQMKVDSPEQEEVASAR